MATTWTTDADETITVTAGSSSTSNSWTSNANTKGTIATSDATGNVTVKGTLDVSGATTLSSTLAVTGASTLTGGITGDLSIGGDLTVSGGKITFGNAEVFDNESDGILYLKSPVVGVDATSYTDSTASFLIQSDAGYDSKLALYEGATIKWSIGNDGSDDSTHKLHFDYNNTTVAGASKLSLDSSGNMILAGDLTVTGNDIVSSSATALTLSGADVEVKGDLTVTGNNISGSGGGIITFSGDDISFADNVTLASETCQLKFGADGEIILQHVADTGLQLGHTTAATNTIKAALKILHNTSGTPAVGIGSEIIFRQEFPSSNYENLLTLQGVTTNVGSGTEAADFVVKILNGGSNAERLRVTGAGYLRLSGNIIQNSAGETTISMDADQHIAVEQGKYLRFDGASGHTLIYEGAADRLDFVAGGITLITAQEHTTQASQIVELDNDTNLKVGGSAYFESQIHQDHTSGGITVDWNTSNKQSVDVTGTGYTLTMTNPGGPCNLILKVIQGDGNDTITTWAASSGSVYWQGGAAPTLSTSNGEIDIISFYFDGTNYFGMFSTAFATV